MVPLSIEWRHFGVGQRSIVTVMSTRFDKVVEVMATLRAEEGCPWDRKQTHESLKPYLLEETYEVLETIDQRDPRKLQEELGDVLLQVLFHSQIATESRTFSIEDVLDTLATKLIRRHPHVFTPNKESDQERVSSSEQVLTQWEEIKRAERAADGKPQSALEGVPKTLPALLRAYQIQARASRVGFDWPHNDEGLDQVFGKIQEEISELREALALSQTQTESDSKQPDSRTEIENELGDLLFSLVNLARFLKANPEDTLRRATNRFIDRFQLVEAQAAEAGRKMSDMTLTEMDELWAEAKRRLQGPQAGPTASTHDNRTP